MPCPQDCVARGKVSRVYTTVGENGEGMTFIRLADLPPEQTPGPDRYFGVGTSHPNYNALYSLILVAATNGYDLQVRTEQDINAQSNARIRYLVVDWP